MVSIPHRANEIFIQATNKKRTGGGLVHKKHDVPKPERHCLLRAFACLADGAWLAQREREREREGKREGRRWGGREKEGDKEGNQKPDGEGKREEGMERKKGKDGG